MRPDTDCAKKKAAIHERKILTDWRLFSLKLLCLRCGQNFIIDQLIGLIKGFDHLGRFRMEIDFIQRLGYPTARFRISLLTPARSQRLA